MDPLVTVLMPVYNGEKYLREAIESILSQTFTDFEFLIIDDGSTDGTWEMLKSYHDERIRLIRNEINQKQSISLNIGLRLAKGKYIARMDADDLSLPKRLERQVIFMEEHPVIGVCGTWVKLFGGYKQRIVKHPINNTEIRVGLIFSCCINHPSVIMRSAFLRDHKLYYNPAFDPAEDYEFWIRCSKFFKLANLPEVLLHYRIHEKQLSNMYKSKQDISVNNIRQPQIEALGVDATDHDLSFLNWVPWGENKVNLDSLIKIETVLFDFIRANQESMLYAEPQFSNFIAMKFFIIHYRNNQLNSFLWNIFRQLSLSDSNKIGWFQRISFRIKGIKEALSFIIKYSIFHS